MAMLTIGDVASKTGLRARVQRGSLDPFAGTAGAAAFVHEAITAPRLGGETLIVCE
jgi:hypothetical protein